jgi:hypothetical protein
LTFLEHLALGAGSQGTVQAIAGGRTKYAAGLSATALVAGFKEGADATAGRDTKKQAVFHALSILSGAAIVAASWH